MGVKYGRYWLRAGGYPLMARRLNTIGDVRRYVASLINRVEDGALDPAVAGRLAYMANLMKPLIEGSEHEKRLDEIEKHIYELKDAVENAMALIGITIKGSKIQ